MERTWNKSGTLGERNRCQEFLMIRQTGNDAAGVIVVDQEEGEDWRMEEDALVKLSD